MATAPSSITLEKPAGPATGTAPTAAGDGDHTTPVGEERDRHADSVIRANVYLSAASGLIPFPMIDTVTTLAVDLKMLMELSDVYRVEFRKDIGKSAIGAFIGSLGPAMTGGAILGSATLN